MALPPVLILFNQPGTLRCHQKGVGLQADEDVLEEVAAVESALCALGCAVRTESVRSLRDVGLAVQAASEPCVFNLVEALEGDFRDVALVSAICRAAGKGCTGNDEFAQWLCLDKLAAQRRLADAGLIVPGGCRVGPTDPIPALEGRVIVKPLCADAGEGIDDRSVLDGADRKALAERARWIHETFGQAALIEPFIDGRELNVSIVEFEDGPRVMPMAEIEFVDYPPDRPRIVGYDAKWNAGSFVYANTRRNIPADLPESTARRIRDDALLAWRALQCRDYVRMDLRVDARGVPWFIETNPNPDIAPDAGFAASIAAGGHTYPEFVRRSIELAMRNCAARGSVAAPASPGAPATAAPSIALMRRDQRDATLELLRETSVFEPYEIDVAAEVIDVALQQGAPRDYHSYVSKDDSGAVTGWVCFGRVPCTESTWDIYWLAVRPAEQGRGLGRALMAFAERSIAQLGGTLAIVETAGRPAYRSTRAFYERIGYEKVSVIADFYAPGDPKVTYARRLAPAPDA